MTPLSAPISRLVRPTGSSMSSSRRWYLACLRTERWKSATAHSVLGWLMHSYSRSGDGNRGGQLEGGKRHVESGQRPGEPAEAHPLDHSPPTPARPPHPPGDCP